MLQANLPWADTGHSTAVGCSTVGVPGMWGTMWGIMQDHGALCVTMGCSTMGYREMWHHGLPGDKATAHAKPWLCTPGLPAAGN